MQLRTFSSLVSKRVIGLIVGCLLVGLAKGAESASPFGNAKWLWPSELKNAANVCIEIRRQFDLSETRNIRLTIAADTVARISLNGLMQVETLRFPDVPPQRYYDVIALSGGKVGRNELIVELYVQGIDSFQHLSGDPGVVFSIDSDGSKIVSGRECEWRVVPAMRSDVPLVTQQLGYSFEYDADKPSARWRPFLPQDIIKTANDYRFEQRPVPRVEVGPAVVSSVVAFGSLDGGSPAEMPAEGMDRARMTPLPRDAFYEADGQFVRRDMFESGFYYLVDLGREEVGLLSLDVETDAGAVLDIGYAEHAENGRIRTNIVGRNFCGRYRTTEGRQTFVRWERRIAGRYLQLHVRGVRTRFCLRGLSVLPTTVPVRRIQAPTFADPRSKRIWDVGVRTLELCMHEHYEDCPWREQGLYANDARNQILAGYYAFGAENRFPEMSLEILSRGIGDDGWGELCMPAHIKLKIPSFTFCWILAVNDNLRYRGKSDFVKKMFPLVAHILDCRCSELRDGLLPCPQGEQYWQFYDWTEGLSGGTRVKPGELRFDLPLNLFFVLALEAGVEIASACGDSSVARRWRQVASELRPTIRNRFWDADKCELFLRGKGDGHAAELVQALGLLAHVVPASAKGDVVAKLLGPSEWTPATLSQMIYKFDALMAEGGDVAVCTVRQMNDIWTEMLDRGATSFWEVREGWKAFEGAGSLCHGWSAIPLYVYGAYPVSRSVPAKSRVSRMDRSKLQIGAYCLAPYSRTDRHVREVKDCGVDFIYGVPASDRKTLDLCMKYGLGTIASGAVPFWHGMGGDLSGKMRQLKPLSVFEKSMEGFRDHPAIWMIDLADEPSALDMEYLGVVADFLNGRLPVGVMPYVNLYPNYASTVSNGKNAVTSQLGTTTYEEYVQTCVCTMPLDYVSWDFYPYTPRDAHRAKFLQKNFENFLTVAEACHKTGRSLWFVPQVNSYHADEFISLQRLRFQSNLALAFGAEVINWACWSIVGERETPDMPGLTGWWHNNVLDLKGEKTVQYDRLKVVNAELHEIGSRYMDFRCVATYFIGSPTIPELDACGLFVKKVFEGEDIHCLHADDGGALIVGDFVSRDSRLRRRAIVVFAVDDPWDEHQVERGISFKTEGVVSVWAGSGQVPVERTEGECWNFRLRSSQAALIVVNE